VRVDFFVNSRVWMPTPATSKVQGPVPTWSNQT
jgi:hypothetical protein